MRKGFLRAKWLGLASLVLALVSGSGQAVEPLTISDPSLTPPAVMLADSVPDRCPRFWGNAEYLLWWVKSAPLPAPILTLGDSTNLGVLGQPGTQILAGGSDVHFGPSSGGRFTLGAWLDDERRVGWEGSYFFLGQRSNVQSFHSNVNGSPLLAIPFVQVGGPAVNNPFFTPTSLGETSTAVSEPGIFAGGAIIGLTTRLQGAELNEVWRLVNHDGWRVDLLGGFRFLNLRETFTLDTTSPDLQPPGVFDTHDFFGAQNYFYGGQLGTRVEYGTDRMFVTFTGKVAMGVMQERVQINGLLLTNDLDNHGAVQAFPGGYLALPSNSGVHNRNEFGLVPEVGLSVGYYLTAQTRLTVGYNFLYVNDVLRPGNQIDRAINIFQAPAISGIPPQPVVGPLSPMFPIRSDDFWVHGLSFGLELRY